MSFISFFIKTSDRAMDKAWNNYKFTGIEETRDIVYDKGNKKVCMLDIYRPAATHKQPVFFNIHGGGFVGGSRYGRRGLSRYIASLGFAVVNIEYGLAPKFKYPENLMHCVTALKWVQDNAEEYRFDLDKLVISGDSAGGYLSSALTGLCVSEKFRKRLGVTGLNIRPMGALYFCGIYDMPYSVENKSMLNMVHSIAKEAFGIKKLTREVFNDYEYTDVVSPVDHIGEDYPPVFVAHTESDLICVKQGERIIDRLKDKNITHWEFRATKKANCIHCWHLTQRDPRAKACLGAAAEFLYALLKGEVENRYDEI